MQEIIRPSPDSTSEQGLTPEGLIKLENTRAMIERAIGVHRAEFLAKKANEEIRKNYPQPGMIPEGIKKRPVSATAGFVVGPMGELPEGWFEPLKSHEIKHP